MRGLEKSAPHSGALAAHFAETGGTLEIWAAKNAGAEFSKVHAAPHSGEMVRTLKSSAAFWRNESLPRRKGAAQRVQLLDTPRGVYMEVSINH